MTIVRPVTQRVASTLSLQEDTSLPFSVVITPFGDRAELPRRTWGEDEDGTSAAAAAAAAGAIGNQTQSLPTNYAGGTEGRAKASTTTSKNNGKKGADSTTVLPSTLVAKCTHCGAPLNPCSPRITTFQYLCGLCGRTFSTDPEVQFEARSKAEYISSKERAMYWSRYRGGRNSSSAALEETSRHMIEYALPVSRNEHSKNNTQKDISEGGRDEQDTLQNIYEIPANECPPLLIILVDATSPDSRYYDVVCRSINKAIENAPSHAHIGLFLLSQNGGLSAFDLSSPFPHLKHCRVDAPPPEEADAQEVMEKPSLLNDRPSFSFDGDDNDFEEEEFVPLIDVLDIRALFVPLCSYHRSHVENALRALGDHTLVVDQACHRDDFVTGNAVGGVKGRGPYIGASIHSLLNLLDDANAFHPGMLQQQQESDDEGFFDATGDDSVFRYAGGKMYAFLSGPPAEMEVMTGGGDNDDDDDEGEIFQHTSNIGAAKDHIGTGGFGGSCAEPGQRYGIDRPSDTYASYYGTASSPVGQSRRPPPVVMDSFDPEGGGQNDTTSTEDDANDANEDNEHVLPTCRYPDIDEYFDELGTRCAAAAFGVELFVIPDEINQHSYIGIPVLRLLSDRSGGCGPLLVKLDERLADTSAYSSGVGVGGSNFQSAIDALLAEVKARSPWVRPMAFGTMLRLRLTPTLGIDRTPFEPIAHDNSRQPRPVKFYRNKGILGPFSPSPDGDDDLWIAGSCDDTTTLACDLDIISSSGHVSSTVFVEGRGDVNLSPGVQSCFAYTSVVKNEDGQYVTVRRLRVLTTNVKVAVDSETLTNSLDAEALAVVLFHKLSAASMDEGLLEARDVAQTWLISTLLCAYRSAEVHEVRTQMRSSRGLSPCESDSLFFPDERLLDRQGGRLNNREKLLARGHARLCSLPLLTYALIQCDALRPREGTFQPSSDARCAASSNLSAMPPASLARGIAPRIEVWLSGDNCTEPVIDSVNMNIEALRQVVMEYQPVGEEQILSSLTASAPPTPILFVDSPRLVMIFDCRYLGNSQNSVEAQEEIKISATLRSAVEIAARSYRVPAPVRYFLGGISDTSCGTTPLSLLYDVLLEDSGTSDSVADYQAWSTKIAEQVLEEITVENSDSGL